MTLAFENSAKYKTLVDAIGYLNSSMKVDEVLKALLIKSVELLDYADTGLIFLYNQELDILEVKSVYGFEQSAYDIVIRPGESLTGLAFLNNQSIVANGVENIRRYMSEITFYNNLGRSADDFLGRPISEANGAIACPIRVKAVCIGVLVVDNFESDGHFSEEDVDILEAISVQAALAIANAQIIEKTECDKKALEVYSKIVESERNKYEYTIQLHNRFTNMLLEGASFSAILKEIAQLLHSEIVFFNKYKNLVEFGVFKALNSGFVQSNIDAIQKNMALKTIFSGRIGLYYVRTQPIIVENENNGWITVIRDSEGYSTEEEIIIDRAIAILALEIIKNQQVQNIESKYRGDFIDTLLLNQNKEMIHRYSKQYHIDLSQNHRLMLIELSDRFSRDGQEAKDKLFESVIAYTIQLIPIIIDHKKSVFISSKLNTIFILMPERVFDRTATAHFFNRIVACNHKAFLEDIKNIQITAVVSDAFQGHASFSAVYFSINKILQQIKGMQIDSYIGFYEDFEIKRLLLNNSEECLKEFLNHVLGPLLVTSSKNRELLKTLRLYIRSKDNWSDTKDKLYIHGNTLSQRLKRINVLLGLDLSDYNDHFKIQLALEVYELFYEQSSKLV